MYDIVNMAKIAKDVYDDAANSSMLKDWSTGQIQDLYENDNFRARVYWRTGSARIACVCFRGTDNWKDTVYADMGGIGLGLNALAMKINDAVTFTSMVARKADIVWLTGHSLGGAFVQIVGAICQLPGVTWNAPGCLALINQMSSSPVRKLVGGAGSAGVSMLSSLISAGIGGQIVTLLNKAAAAGGDEAFAPIVNFRGNMDPVSLVGAHVGLPLQTIQLASQSPHPHSMVPIIQALETRRR